jgi:hypothetical protein
MDAICSSETSGFSELRSVTTQNTAFFTVTAARTSNHTKKKTLYGSTSVSNVYFREASTPYKDYLKDVGKLERIKHVYTIFYYRSTQKEF